MGLAREPRPRPPTAQRGVAKRADILSSLRSHPLNSCQCLPWAKPPAWEGKPTQPSRALCLTESRVAPVGAVGECQRMPQGPNNYLVISRLYLTSAVNHAFHPTAAEFYS